MRYRIHILIGICLTGLIACVDMDSEDSEERAKLVAQGIEIRLEDFREREWEKCQARALNKAIQLADSTIRARARQEAVEPIIKPPKPSKPDKPSLKAMPDSLRKDSLIKQEIQQY